jgi:C-terminal processing protease CtpA/Prc
VIGWRADGRVATARQVAEVEIVAGEETVVSFTFPTEPVTGVGVDVDLTDLGAEVREVFPGSPAEAAGLEPGDVVVAVDGVDVAEMTEAEYLEAIDGPEGTPVSFRVAHEGDTGEVEQVVDAMRQPFPLE